MGYTHYWSKTKRIEISQQQKALMVGIVKEHADILDAAIPPEMKGKCFLFLNGKGGDSHETFIIERKENDFEFCKTARKPYDIVVCKILLVMSLSDGFTFSSDGIWQENGTEELKWEEEWQEAMDWFKELGFDPKEAIARGR